MHSDIKTSLLLETQVFPTIAFFKHALDKKIIIEAHEHYQKEVGGTDITLGLTKEQLACQFL